MWLRRKKPWRPWLDQGLNITPPDGWRVRDVTASGDEGLMDFIIISLVRERPVGGGTF